MVFRPEQKEMCYSLEFQKKRQCIRIKNNKFNKRYIAYLVTKVVFESILLLSFPCISSS